VPRASEKLLGARRRGFWSVGHKLGMTCCGADGKPYQMTMAKDSPDFAVSKKRILLPFKGTDLMIYPLLPGLRSLTGEKSQRYLASELRDRIKQTGVTVKVIDRTGHNERWGSGQANLLNSIEYLQNYRCILALCRIF
jgi:hypothetical protein